MKVVLIGFMGTGKSKVGRILAKKLAWPHRDTDEAIAREAGLSPGDLIRERGEPAFRAVERAVVKRLAAEDACVLSTGGGVPLDPESMIALESDAVVVWLKARPETILRRVGDARSRPLIDAEDPLGSIRRRLADREAVYGRAAFSIDTDDLSAEAAADRILALLPARPS